MTMYIVVNGPPKSGRSTLARMIQKRILHSHQAEMHSPLKHFFCAALAAKWSSLANDKPRGILNGRNTVDALRQLRNHLRSLYGPDVLGKWLHFRVLGMKPIPQVVIVDDALFTEDVEALRDNRVHLIRITREGTGDFTPIPNPSYTVINAYDIRYLGKRADQIVGEIMSNARPVQASG